MNSSERTTEKRWRWYHGMAFYAGVQAVSFGLGKLAQRAGGTNDPRLGESLTGNDSNNTFYNRLAQPVFAPADWVFAPVWTLNNALCIKIQRAAAGDKRTGQRDKQKVHHTDTEDTENPRILRVLCVCVVNSCDL